MRMTSLISLLVASACVLVMFDVAFSLGFSDGSPTPAQLHNDIHKVDVALGIGIGTCALLTIACLVTGRWIVALLNIVLVIAVGLAGATFRPKANTPTEPAQPSQTQSSPTHQCWSGYVGPENCPGG